jgi:16S rRNA (guanine966-N2)-methyltransferase
MRSRASSCKRPGPGWIGRDALERSNPHKQSWGAKVRLIAGSAGGRRLAVVPGGVTRPTTDRVREALFSAITSWLGTSDRPAEATLAGIAFCDLYAGSGAVGLEAASRGANPVLLVEADRRIAALAVRNARELGLPAKVQTARVEALLRRSTQQPFDILFADPPYDLESSHLDDLLTAILRGWIKPHGLVLIERSLRSPRLTWPPAFGPTWARTYGETIVEFGAVDSLRAN